MYTPCLAILLHNPAPLSLSLSQAVPLSTLSLLPAQDNQKPISKADLQLHRDFI